MSGQPLLRIIGVLTQLSLLKFLDCALYFKPSCSGPMKMKRPSYRRRPVSSAGVTGEPQLRPLVRQGDFLRGIRGAYRATEHVPP